MIELLLKISTFVSLLVFAIILLVGGVKFFRIWINLREESLFHLAMMCFGLLAYFLFINWMILNMDDREMVDFMMKHLLGLIFTPLYLEVSLYYLTTYINRRNLWEKYFPFLFGIMVGVSFLLLTLPDSDPYFGILAIIAYGVPVVLTSILLVRICLRSYTVFKESELAEKDRSFILAFTLLTIIMFFGSLFDASFFIIIAVTGIDLWPLILPVSGTLGPIMVIIAAYYFRRIIRMIDDADILYIMNILS
ncbi:MAG: hypothetical protein ACW99R_18360 [Candidatus Hodarchaeales archaeon]|jgi:hypothetical protein